MRVPWSVPDAFERAFIRRGILPLIVVCCHSLLVPLEGFWVSVATCYSMIAVSAFLCLSGLVITLSRRHGAGVKGRVNLKAFYWLPFNLAMIFLAAELSRAVVEVPFAKLRTAVRNGDLQDVYSI